MAVTVTERLYMKIWRAFIIVVVLLSGVFAYIHAHPGRTDGAGGHTNHSTGEYHYHHGYNDHQHYDMDGDGIADCPYDFNDNTSHKDSGSGSQQNSISDEYHRIMQDDEDILGYWERKAIELEEEKSKEKSYTASTADDKGEKKISAKNIFGIILAVIIIFPPVIVVPISYICSKVRDLIQKIKKK